ncbi:hypothetical protein RDWZM_005670 [Blomia tropicalis]|uniref:ABC transporter domain-containing protein n=1 Tax=Blomia tropicalis TaxID=40697 RepID=A0A9Q0M4F7_BLOTA|nr:hypothetical protein RDWZM_005670 [Blomia tropicalis]
MSTQIIKNVSGEAPAGTTLAIMGSSGAGKTTLLNVLTARNLSQFTVDGCVKINDQIADVNMITTMSAYVQQVDLFIPTLTVREHLVFQSLVRMDMSLTLEQRAQRIDEVMRELSLIKCADTSVGGTIDSGKGISGGELKRLSFATEILTNPSIMFCDEPTSGLDSFMASNLVSYLEKMAQSGRTIICTIHQPSSETFNLFQRLMLLADGRLAYLGPVKGALDYFNQIGLPCPSNFNPADHYIRELAVLPGQEVTCKKKVNRICDYFERLNKPVDHSAVRQSTFVQPKKIPDSPYKTSIFMQYQALTWRAALMVSREPMVAYVRIIQTIVIAIIIGVLFYKQDYNQIGLMNINGGLFLYIMYLSVQNAFAVVHVFCAEIGIFMREHSSGMYRVDAYYVTKNLAEIPIFVYIPIISACIQYYMIGYNPHFDTFLYFMVVGILVSHVGVSFGYMISCICQKTDIALSVGPPFIVALQLCGGYFVNPDSIPSWLKWIIYASWFQYAFDLLLHNQWVNLDHLDCINIINSTANENKTQLTPTPLPTTLRPTLTTSFWKNETNGTDIGHQSHCNTQNSSMCLGTSEAIFDFYSLGTRSQYIDWGVLAFILFFLRTMGYLALYFRAKQSR